MKVDTNKLDALIKCAKYLKKLEVSYQRNSSVAAIMDGDTSMKKRNAAFNKMETDAEAIEDQLHELHCLAVELGVADRDDSRYGETIVAGGRGIERKFYKREPK